MESKRPKDLRNATKPSFARSKTKNAKSIRAKDLIDMLDSRSALSATERKNAKPVRLKPQTKTPKSQRAKDRGGVELPILVKSKVNESKSKRPELWTDEVKSDSDTSTTDREEILSTHAAPKGESVEPEQLTSCNDMEGPMCAKAKTNI